MERLTKYGKTSHENGVCCTHFMSKECKEVAGDCAWCDEDGECMVVRENEV